MSYRKDNNDDNNDGPQYSLQALRAQEESSAPNHSWNTGPPMSLQHARAREARATPSYSAVTPVHRPTPKAATGPGSAVSAARPAVPVSCKEQEDRIAYQERFITLLQSRIQEMSAAKPEGLGKAKVASGPMKPGGGSRRTKRSGRPRRFSRNGKNQKTHRNARRRQTQRQTQRQCGGGLKEDATEALTTYAASKGMTLDKAFSKILNSSYYEKRDPSYNTMGLTNPCAIGGFVFRTYGVRDYVLQARLKTDSDTPDALKAMRATVARDLYPDKANDAKYVNISELNDR